MSSTIMDGERYCIVNLAGTWWAWELAVVAVAGSLLSYPTGHVDGNRDGKVFLCLRGKIQRENV